MKRGAAELTVGPETIVHFDYQLFDEEGELVEGSDEQLRMSFLYGYGQVVPGIENGLLGARPGERRTIVLRPEEAFGTRDPERVLELDSEGLPDDLEMGDELLADDSEGETIALKVIELGEGYAVLDANHPLAGQTVRLELRVLGVRAALLHELHEARAELEERQFEAGTLLPAARLLRRASEASTGPSSVSPSPAPPNRSGGPHHGARPKRRGSKAVK